MDDPKYKLGQTVRHKFGSEEAVSKIKFVMSQGNKWLYKISNPVDSKETWINEEDIIKEV